MKYYSTVAVWRVNQLLSPRLNGRYSSNITSTLLIYSTAADPDTVRALGVARI